MTDKDAHTGAPSEMGDMNISDVQAQTESEDGYSSEYAEFPASAKRKRTTENECADDYDVNLAEGIDFLVSLSTSKKRKVAERVGHLLKKCEG
jgi:hypothetical protein